MTIPLPVHELSRDEEMRLARRIEAGVFAAYLLSQVQDAPVAHPLPARVEAAPADLESVVFDGRAAWSDFYLANLRLVNLIAARWARLYRLEIEDVFQEGCLGLAHAIRRWDYARGTKFCTLAWHDITWRIRDFCLRRGGACTAPSWWLQMQADLRREADHLEVAAEADIMPQLAERAGRPVTWVENALAWEPPSSTDDLPDQAAPEPDTRTHLADRCHARLSAVPAFERDIIVQHFGLFGARKTYRTLAQSIGCSVNRIKTAEEQGLALLRAALADDADWVEAYAA